MKFAAIAALLAAPAVSFGACWDLVSKAASGSAVGFVDRCSITLDGKLKKAWIKTVFSSADKVQDDSFNDRDYDSAISLQYFDCSNRTSTTKTISYYYNEESVTSKSWPINRGAFEDVIPETTGETTLDFVCSSKPTNQESFRKNKKTNASTVVFNSIEDEENTSDCWQTVAANPEYSIGLNSCTVFIANNEGYAAKIRIKTSEISKKFKVVPVCLRQGRQQLGGGDVPVNGDMRR